MVAETLKAYVFKERNYCRAVRSVSSIFINEDFFFLFPISEITKEIRIPVNYMKKY